MIVTERARGTAVGVFLKKLLIVTVLVAPAAATVCAAVRLVWDLQAGTFTWAPIVLMLVLYLMTGLGITAGFHRGATHRGYTAHPIVEGILLIWGSMALQGTPITWIADHLQHHAYSDKPGDPHSPVVSGFLWSHLGWFFGPKDTEERFTRIARQNPVSVWVTDTYLIWMALTLVGPFLIMGLEGLIWGVGVRLFLVHHSTWSINSVCHIWGYRPYETNDRSRNFWPLFPFTLGECFHNAHHAFPRCAFHGHKWWEFDITGYFIRLGGWLGLLRDVRQIPPGTARG